MNVDVFIIVYSYVCEHIWVFMNINMCLYGVLWVCEACVYKSVGGHVWVLYVYTYVCIYIYI